MAYAGRKADLFGVYHNYGHILNDIEEATPDPVAAHSGQHGEAAQAIVATYAKMGLVPEPLGVGASRHRHQLNLSGFGIGNSVAAAVGVGLSHLSPTHHLHELVLRNNRLTHVGAIHMLRGVETHALRFIDLAHNAIAYAGADMLASSLAVRSAWLGDFVRRRHAHTRGLHAHTCTAHAGVAALERGGQQPW